MPDLEPITREETLLDGGDLTPITRKEMFIKRIYDKNQMIPEPITREEYFLKKAGEGSGGDVTIEQLNVTQNGTYSESGKAYSPVVVNIPTPENAYLLESVEGLPSDIATFEASNLPMNKLKVDIEPQQDLHGYDAPWVGGAGKNKLPLTVDNIKEANGGVNTWTNNSKNISGVVYTIKTDDGGNVTAINANGQASSTSFCNLGSIYNLTIGNKYVIKATYFVKLIQSNIIIDNFPYIWTATREDESMSIRVSAGNSINMDIQIAFYNESDGSLPIQPYSNICPISGWDEANVVISNMIVYNIKFKYGENPLTVYGGTLDVVGGLLTVDRVSVVFDGSNDEKWQADTDGISSDGFVCFRAYLQNNNIKKPEGTVSTISYIGKMLSNTMPTLKNGDVNQYPMANTVMGITGYGYSGTPNNYFYINTNKTLSNIQSVAELRAWLAENLTTVCYELTTPQTYQLTPTQVKSLLGTNNIWADTGKILEAEYFTKGE